MRCRVRPATAIEANRPNAVVEGSGTTKTGVKFVAVLKISDWGDVFTRKIDWPCPAGMVTAAKVMLLYPADKPEGLAIVTPTSGSGSFCTSLKLVDWETAVVLIVKLDKLKGVITSNAKTMYPFCGIVNVLVPLLYVAPPSTIASGPGAELTEEPIGTSPIAEPPASAASELPLQNTCTSRALDEEARQKMAEMAKRRLLRLIDTLSTRCSTTPDRIRPILYRFR